MDVQLQCSSEVLDPSITNVFKPTRKDDEVCTMSRTPHSHVLFAHFWAYLCIIL